MVIISQKDFNKSMEMYLGSRKTGDSKMFRSFKGSVSKMASRMKGTIGYTLPKNLNDYEVHVERAEKRPTIFQRLFSRKTKGEKKEIIDDIKTEPEEVKEEIEDIAEEYDVLGEVEEDIEKKREGLFRKMIGILKPRSSNNHDDIPVDKVRELIGHDEEDISNNNELKVKLEEVKNDLKAISKIAYNVMEQLPDEQKINFKNTKHFYDYKEILKKYGLIK